VNTDIPVSEGLASTPLELTAPPIKNHIGQYGSDTSSYYSIPVNPSTSYKVTLDSSNDYVYLNISSGSAENLHSCVNGGAGNGNLSCIYTTRPEDTTMNLVIRPVWYAKTGSKVLISVKEY